MVYVVCNGLYRQSLNGTGTGKNGSLYIMLNTSHCNLWGNLYVTRNLWNGFPTYSAPYVIGIDRNVLSLIYPAMNSSCSVKTGINNCQPLVYTFIPSFIPNMILNGSIYEYYI